MTSEQLQNARAARWRQAGNPLLTAEETRSWIEDAGLCLFAPRRAHFAAPAPSLAEAVAGAVTDAPTRETVETATALLKRLAADAAVVPLNLFGGAGAPGAGFGAAAVAGGAGLGSFDTPDFVMAREVLPYVFSLIGGRNWKSGPGDKASPLMVEVWTLLRDEGAKSAAEIQRTLGREVTEAAVLRALGELWHGLRVVPAYDAAETRWEVTQARFAAEMTASQKVAQTTALSALVSLYLDSVVAAEREEIEVFLSPLAARSRVREVVNGLQATRQLELVSVGAHPLLHVTGSLAEFQISEAASQQVSESASQRVSESAGQRGGRPASQRGTEASGREYKKPFEKKRFEKKPFERKPFGKRGEEGEERPPFRERREERGERRPFEKKRFEKKPFERKPFEKKRFEGEREGFGKKRFGAGRPFEKKPFGKRREEGEDERRPFEKKRFEKKPFERKPFGKKRVEGERGGFAKKRFEGERREFGERGRFGDREGFKKKPYGKKPGGFRKRDESESRPPRRQAQDRPFAQERREGWGARPFGKQGGPFAKGKPGFKSAKPGFKKTGKPFGKPGFKKDRPGFGKAGGFKRPGGFGPPRRKRKEEGSGDGE